MTPPTPMLDAARRTENLDVDWPEQVRLVLRAALPWTPPPEVIEAQRSAHCLVTCGSTSCLRAKECRAIDVEHDREAALAAYRAHPLMSELWPEEER